MYLIVLTWKDRFEQSTFEAGALVKRQNSGISISHFQMLITTQILLVSPVISKNTYKKPLYGHEHKISFY